MVESTSLLKMRSLNSYRGFESLPHRHLLTGFPGLEQPVNNGTIRRSEIESSDLSMCQPVKGLMLMRVWFHAVVCKPADKGMKHNASPFVGPRNGRPFTGDDDLTTKLFRQFPVQGLSWGFVKLHLAAWKLPQTCEALSGRPLSKKYPVSPLDDGADYVDGRHDLTHDQRDGWRASAYPASVR